MKELYSGKVERARKNVMNKKQGVQNQRKEEREMPTRLGGEKRGEMPTRLEAVCRGAQKREETPQRFGCRKKRRLAHWLPAAI